MKNTKTSNLPVFVLLPPPSSPPCAPRLLRRYPPVRWSEGLVPCGQRHRDHKRACATAKPSRALPSHAGCEHGHQDQHNLLGSKDQECLHLLVLHLLLRSEVWSEITSVSYNQEMKDKRRRARSFQTWSEAAGSLT